MQTPQVIGKYEILGRLGAGGMSEVFLARRTGAAGFEKKVALKRLASHQVEDELMIKSLINEAHLAAQLSHPNLVQVFEFEYIDDAYCMAMEYIDGMTFDAMLNRCRALEIPVPRGLVVYLALEVCAGLDYAHTARSDDGTPFSLVHRDIKPSNIMISRNGLIKIMDFGIAKAATNPYKTTQGGGVKGTLAYMSPEQISGSESLAATSDLFSLGVILYEASTLERLFDDSNLFKLATTMHQGLRTECRDRVQAWFPELVPILERLLSAEPEHRYPDARSLMMALRPLSFNASSLEMAAFLEDLAAVPGDGNASAGTVSSQGAVLRPIGSGEPAAPPAVRREGQAPSPSADPVAHSSEGPQPRPGRAAESGFDRRRSDGMSGSSSVQMPPVRGVKRTVFAATIIGAMSAAGVFGWLQTREERSAEPVGALQAPGGVGAADSAGRGAGSAGGAIALRDGGKPQAQTGTEPVPEAAPRGEGALSARSGASPAGAAPSGAGSSGPVSSGAGSSGPAPSGTGSSGAGPSRAGSSGAGSSGPAPSAAQPSPKTLAPTVRTAGANGRSSSRSPTPSRAAPVKEPADSRTRGVGQLTVNADPWAEVYVDGVKRGMSPYRGQVSAGTHQVRLLSSDGHEKSFSVNVAADTQVLKVWSFKDNDWVQ